jgi:hypothetical protein
MPVPRTGSRTAQSLITEVSYLFSLVQFGEVDHVPAASSIACLLGDGGDRHTEPTGRDRYRNLVIAPDTLRLYAVQN